MELRAHPSSSPLADRPRVQAPARLARDCARNGCGSGRCEATRRPAGLSADAPTASSLRCSASSSAGRSRRRCSSCGRPTRAGPGRRSRRSRRRPGAALARGLALVAGASRPFSSSRTAGPQRGRRQTASAPGGPLPSASCASTPTPTTRAARRRASPAWRRARGWSSVVVVSYRYHIARARILFERCFDGAVYATGRGESFLSRLVAAPSETVKLGYALLLRRSC